MRCGLMDLSPPLEVISGGHGHARPIELMTFRSLIDVVKPERALQVCSTVVQVVAV